MKGGLTVTQKHKRAGVVRLIVQLTVFILVFLITVSKYLAEKEISIPLLPDASLHDLQVALS